MLRSAQRLPLVTCGLLLLLSCAQLPLARAADGGKAEPTPQEREMVLKVFKRLTDVMKPFDGYDVWPPELEFVDDWNFFAGPREKDGKKVPTVFVGLPALREVVGKDEDAMALILGHELGHLYHKHTFKRIQRDSKVGQVTEMIAGREAEFESDVYGKEKMLEAGFSFARGKRVWQKIRGAKGKMQGYTSIEGYSLSHPSWDDRIAKADQDEAKYWTAMSSFRNGVEFLTMQNYVAAQMCFEVVTKEFPKCYEGWLNLGYCYLMQYMDKLDSDDIKSFDIGQIVSGGFYRRADSLSPDVRGKDTKLWFAAVGALRRALDLKADMTLAKAYLGLAYLIHPDGRDVGEATRWLTEAAEGAASDTSLDPYEHAVVLVNLGVVKLAGDKPEEMQKAFEQCDVVAKKAGGKNLSQTDPSIGSALLYNRALVLGNKQDKDSRREAHKLLVQYLRATSPMSTYWKLGYERYQKLCAEIGEPVMKEADFASAEKKQQYRPVLQLPVKDGVTIALTESIASVRKKLGECRVVTIVPNTNLKRYIFDQHGLEILANENVQAIILTGNKSPDVKLALEGTAPGEGVAVRVGMPLAELDKHKDSIRWSGTIDVLVKDKRYRNYRDLGLAIRVNKGQGVVEEIVITRAPAEKPVG